MLESGSDDDDDDDEGDGNDGDGDGDSDSSAGSSRSQVQTVVGTNIAAAPVVVAASPPAAHALLSASSSISSLDFGEQSNVGILATMPAADDARSTASSTSAMPLLELDPENAADDRDGHGEHAVGVAIPVVSTHHQPTEQVDHHDNGDDGSFIDVRDKEVMVDVEGVETNSAAEHQECSASTTSTNHGNDNAEVVFPAMSADSPLDGGQKETDRENHISSTESFTNTKLETGATEGASAIQSSGAPAPTPTHSPTVNTSPVSAENDQDTEEKEIPQNVAAAAAAAAAAANISLVADLVDEMPQETQCPPRSKTPPSTPASSPSSLPSPVSSAALGSTLMPQAKVNADAFDEMATYVPAPAPAPVPAQKATLDVAAERVDPTLHLYTPQQPEAPEQPERPTTITTMLLTAPTIAAVQYEAVTASAPELTQSAPTSPPPPSSTLPPTTSLVGITDEESSTRAVVLEILQSIVDAAADGANRDAAQPPLQPTAPPTAKEEEGDEKDTHDGNFETDDVHRSSSSAGMAFDFAQSGSDTGNADITVVQTRIHSEELEPFPEASVAPPAALLLSAPATLGSPQDTEVLHTHVTLEQEPEPSDNYDGVVDLLLRAAADKDHLEDSSSCDAASPQPDMLRESSRDSTGDPPMRIASDGVVVTERIASMSVELLPNSTGIAPTYAGSTSTSKGSAQGEGVPTRVALNDTEEVRDLRKDQVASSAVGGAAAHEGENEKEEGKEAVTENSRLSIMELLLAAAGPEDEDEEGQHPPTLDAASANPSAQSRNDTNDSAYAAEVEATVLVLDRLLGSTGSVLAEDDGAGEAATGTRANSISGSEEGADAFALARSRLSGRRRSVSTPSLISVTEGGANSTGNDSDARASSPASARRELKVILMKLDDLSLDDGTRLALELTRDSLNLQLELSGGAVEPLSPLLDTRPQSSPIPDEHKAQMKQHEFRIGGGGGGRAGSSDGGDGDGMSARVIVSPFTISQPRDLLESSDTDEDTLGDELLVGHDFEHRGGFDILRQTPAVIAEQITLSDFEHFRLIRASELSCENGCAWSGKDKAERAPNVVHFTQRFNHVSFWVVKEILDRPSVRNRTAVLSHFIKIAKELKKLNNLHGLLAVLSALRMAPIYRLRKTWAELKSRSQARFDSLLRFISEDYNHKDLRLAMEKLRLKNENCIPALGILQTDLVHLADSKLDPETLMFQTVEQVAKILHFQTSEFRFVELPASSVAASTVEVREYLNAFNYTAKTRKRMEDENWDKSLSRERKAGTADDVWSIDDYRADVAMHSMGIRARMGKKLATLPRSLGIKGDTLKVFVKGHRKTRSLGAAIGQTVSTLWNSAGRSGTGEHEYASMKSPEGIAGGIKSPKSAKSSEIGKGRVGKKRASYDVLDAAPHDLFKPVLGLLDDSRAYDSSDSESGFDTPASGDDDNDDDHDDASGGELVHRQYHRHLNPHLNTPSPTSTGELPSSPREHQIEFDADDPAIVKQGTLRRKAGIRGYSRYWGVLNNKVTQAPSLTLYGRKHKGHDRDSFKHRSGTSFPLAGCEVCVADQGQQEKQPSNLQKIHVKLGSGKVLHFKTDSPEVRNEWVAALLSATSHNNTSPQSTRDAGGSAAVSAGAGASIAGVGSRVQVTISSDTPAEDTQTSSTSVVGTSSTSSKPASGRSAPASPKTGRKGSKSPKTLKKSRKPKAVRASPSPLRKAAGVTASTTSN